MSPLQPPRLVPVASCLSFAASVACRHAACCHVAYAAGPKIWLYRAVSRAKTRCVEVGVRGLVKDFERFQEFWRIKIGTVPVVSPQKVSDIADTLIYIPGLISMPLETALHWEFESKQPQIKGACCPPWAVVILCKDIPRILEAVNQPIPKTSS